VVGVVGVVVVVVVVVMAVCSSKGGGREKKSGDERAEASSHLRGWEGDLLGDVLEMRTVKVTIIGTVGACPDDGSGTNKETLGLGINNKRRSDGR